MILNLLNIEQEKNVINSEPFTNKYNLLCYVMLGGLLSILQKRVHDLNEVKPCNFRFFWRLICYQDSASSSKLVRRTYQTDVHGEVSWMWVTPVWGTKWKMLVWFICRHSSDLLNSIDRYWLSKYTHQVIPHKVVAFGSIWGCILQLYGFQMYSFLKPLLQKVSLHYTC